MLKSEAVLQFVSNCHTMSKREAYAEELANDIPVTQRGACHNHSCPGEECVLVEMGKKPALFRGIAKFSFKNEGKRN